MQMLCFIRRKRDQRYIWWRCGKVCGKGKVWEAHVDALIPPEGPATQTDSVV